MSTGPAYKSFVAGECTPQMANQLLTPPIKAFLTDTMYSLISTKQTFYHVGFQKYLFLLRKQRTLSTEMESVVKYFYNRQLIVQMTMTPQKCGDDPDNPFYVSVPLYKAPHYEVQTDILQLLPEQVKINFNMRYLLVIVDTFSRFIWTCPVISLKAIKVQKAFITALSRPGESVENYHFLREKIQRVVIDGGSEFKDVFPDAIKLYFPNAELITSSAKNRTGNRPTGNGPIEAAIRLLRRVLRDYSLAINPNFLEMRKRKPHYGLSKILYAYNNTIQIALHNKTPSAVAAETMDPKLQQQLQNTVAHVENQRNEKIMLRQKNLTLLGGSQVTMDRHGTMAYRIYKPPGQFAKEVDIKVSLKVYVVDRVDPGKPQFVDLIEYGNGTDTLKNVLWNTLVLVKTPIDNGPPAILRHFTTVTAIWGFQRPTPKEISQPFYISKDIIQAIAGAPDANTRKRQLGYMNEPLAHKRRRNANRVVRFRGEYEE